MIRIVLFLICVSCFAADASLKMHLSFNSAADFTSGKIIDLSGNNTDGWQMNPTNWITRVVGVHTGYAAMFTTNAIMCDGTPDGQVRTNYPTGWPDDPPAGVNFYPASQYIAVTNISAIQYLTNGTISLWAQFTSKQLQSITYVLDAAFNPKYADDGAVASSNGWRLCRSPLSTYLNMRVYTSTTTDSDADLVVRWPTTGGTTASLNLYTVTFSCDSGQAIAYYDGSPYQTNTIPNNIPWFRIYNYLCIGASQHDGTPTWGDDRYPNDCYHYGKLADIRIYNRVLTADEVLDLYNSTDAAPKQRLGRWKAATP